jgi:transcriptional regulator with XRE-family HTH domain
MISKTLRHIRKNVRKYSQAKVAELTGIPQTTLSCWERNIGEPSASQVMVLAKALEVPLETLLNTKEAAISDGQ